MRLRRIIPFKWMPASWGLKGKSREIAEAEYYWTGIDLETKLATINYTGHALEKRLLDIKHMYHVIDTYQWQLDNVELDFKYDNITEFERDRDIININEMEGKLSADEAAIAHLSNKLKHNQITELEHKTSLLWLDFKNGKITQNEYDKEVATLKNEPYVNVIKMGIDNSAEGYFELDWNDAFVKMLYDEGLTGISDEDVVNAWFNRVCRTVLLQEGADLDYGMQHDTGSPDVEYRSNR